MWLKIAQNNRKSYQNFKNLEKKFWSNFGWSNFPSKVHLPAE